MTIIRSDIQLILAAVCLLGGGILVGIGYLAAILKDRG